MIRPNGKAAFAGLLVTLFVLTAGCSNQTPTQGTTRKNEQTSPTTAGKGNESAVTLGEVTLEVTGMS